MRQLGRCYTRRGADGTFEAGVFAHTVHTRTHRVESELCVEIQPRNLWRSSVTRTRNNSTQLVELDFVTVTCVSSTAGRVSIEKVVNWADWDRRGVVSHVSTRNEACPGVFAPVSEPACWRAAELRPSRRAYQWETGFVSRGDHRCSPPASAQQRSRKPFIIFNAFSFTSRSFGLHATPRPDCWHTR